jgi:hypothetical protein
MSVFVKRVLRKIFGLKLRWSDVRVEKLHDKELRQVQLEL